MRTFFGAAFVMAAIGGYMTTQGGIKLGQTSTHFDYESATRIEQKAWLDSQIEPIRRNLKWSLPSGGAPTQPSFYVGEITTNAARRSITVEINVRGRYQIDRAQIPNVRKALKEQLCPTYAKSPSGRNGISLHHKFIGKNGQQEMKLTVSPSVCRISI